MIVEENERDATENLDLACGTVDPFRRAVMAIIEEVDDFAEVTRSIGTAARARARRTENLAETTLARVAHS
jgi:hypothetical protein